MVPTVLQLGSNGKPASAAVRERQLSAHALATGLQQLLAWQGRAEEQLQAVREQLELSQWSLFIKEELEEARPGQFATDTNTPRKLLMIAAGFFQAAQAAMTALLQDAAASTADIPDPFSPDTGEATTPPDAFSG